MQPKAQADGDVDRRHRTLGDVQRLEDQQIAAMFVEPVADLHDPAIAFRSILLAAIALVPNGLPIFVVLGLLGWAGEPINMGTAIRWMQLPPEEVRLVWMPNLMKYKPVATYEGGAGPAISGRESEDLIGSVVSAGA